jgi:hypothetical protein
MREVIIPLIAIIVGIYKKFVILIQVSYRLVTILKLVYLHKSLMCLFVAP